MTHTPAAGHGRPFPIAGWKGAKERNDLATERPKPWTRIGDRKRHLQVRDRQELAVVLGAGFTIDRRHRVNELLVFLWRQLDDRPALFPNLDHRDFFFLH